jgi:hypothetical protein
MMEDEPTQEVPHIHPPLPIQIALQTSGELPATQAMTSWLTEQGEPFTLEDDRIVLRALPVSVEPEGVHELGVQVVLTFTTPVMRAVDLIFDLSVLAGADVVVAEDRTNRAGLWLRLADEQDRMRIAMALALAKERGSADEVLRRLWAVLHSLHPQQDVRWSAEVEAIVRLEEVGAPDGVPLEAAGDRQIGDLVPRRLPGAPHLLVWRWLSEAYPSLAEL